MFYCTPCAREHGYPVTPQRQYLRKKCDECGKKRTCNQMNDNIQLESIIHKKTKLEKMKTKERIEKVEDMAKTLIAAVGSTTTLNIKRGLRAKYPEEGWTQIFVSETMANSKISGLKYENVSTVTPDGSMNHRLFTIVQPVHTVQSVTKTKKPKKTALLNKVKASRTEIATILRDTKGKFFTITFTKKGDGSVRVMNGRTSKPLTTPLGNFQIIERVNGKNELKQVDPKTISKLKFKGTEYSIK